MCIQAQHIFEPWNRIRSFSPFREDESFRFDRLPDVELDIRAPFKLKGKSDDFDIKADDIFFWGKKIFFSKEQFLCIKMIFFKHLLLENSKKK